MKRDYPPYPLPAALAGLVRDGRVLLVQRAKEAAPRRWGLPGGMVEVGESAAQAALRELSEETGINARAGAVVDTFDLIEHDSQGRIRRHFLMRVVQCDWLAGDGAPASDAAALGWFTLAELPGLALHDRVAELARLLLAPPVTPEDEARRLRAIFDRTFEFIGLLDAQGVVLEANRAALNAVGCTLDQVRGRLFADTPWWSHSAPLQDRLRQAVAQAAHGRFDRFEAIHPGPDGQKIYIDFSISPLADATGRVTHLLPEGRDITARKQVEAALVEARLEAEAASRAQAQFLAAASHELRTPLNAILGFAQTLSGRLFGPLGDDRYGDYAALIAQASQQLDQMIADILDIAGAEPGRPGGRDEMIDVTTLVLALTDLLRPRAETAGLALTVTLPAVLPALRGEPARLRQILFNLIDNAIKFTPPGGSLAIAAAAGPDGLTFTVADTGIGIAVDRQAQVWTPFHQTDATVARRHGGHGLGLAIVRHLAGLQDGRVDLNSMPGHGTTVTVTFPPERLR